VSFRHLAAEPFPPPLGVRGLIPRQAHASSVSPFLLPLPWAGVIQQMDRAETNF